MTAEQQCGDPVQDIGLLAVLLNVPKSLTGFNRILAQFHPVWTLYTRIAEPAQVKKVAIITETIEKIRRGAIDLSKYDEVEKIPPSEGRTEQVKRSRLRKTMNRYYGDYPLYSLFYHECITRAYEPQYQALQASLLPALVELEQCKSEDDQLWDFASSVCRSLRYLGLSDISTSERSLLTGLPIVAVTPGDLQTLIVDSLGRQGHESRPTYGARIHDVLKLLTWYQSRIMARPGNIDRRHFRVHGRAAPQHGATEKQERDHVETAQAALAHGEVLTTTTFLAEDPTEPADEGAYRGIDPPTDAALRGQLADITIPAWTREARRTRSTAMRAKCIGQALEMEAQQLPVTRTSLTGWDLKNLFRVVDDTAAVEWKEIAVDERDHVAAWVTSMFYLSRDEDALVDLQIGGGDSSGKLRVTLSPATLWLPVQTPKHAQVVDGVDLLLTPSKGFTVAAPARLVARLKSLKTRYRRLFLRSYDREAARLFSAINVAKGTHLTATRVTRHLAVQIRQLAPNDETYAVYYQGAEPNRHNPAVYSCVPAARLAELYRQAVELGEHLAGNSGSSATSQIPTLVAEDLDVVGSLYVPRVVAVKERLAAINREIDDLRHTVSSIERKHNAFITLIAFAMMALTGIRATRGSLALRIDIDWKTGVALVSEKDDNRYTNTRLVLIPSVILALLKEYVRHEFQVRRFLATRNPSAVAMLDDRDEIRLLSPVSAPNRNKDLSEVDHGTTYLYFLGSNAAPQPVTRATLKEHLGPTWVLHLGVLRHFVRTQLLLRCASGELIDAQMGHFTRGANAWSRFATLPPAAWRESLGRHLDDLARAIGVRAVDSPLFS